VLALRKKGGEVWTTDGMIYVQMGWEAKGSCGSDFEVAGVD